MSTWDLSPFANHLWQSTLCVGAAWVLTLLVRRNRAAVRYWLWLAASLKFLVPFSLLFSVGSELGWRLAPAITRPQVSFVIEISQPFAPAAPVSPLAITAPVATPLAPVLLCLWLCGFGVSVFVRLRFWHRMRTALRQGSPLHLGIPIPAFSCPARLEPGVFGILRPVLLLPEGIIDRLSSDQLKAIVAHELCHVERRDNLMALIHMAAEAVFWFHPLVWWIGLRLVEEREHACDEAVLRTYVEPQVYAEGILNVCKFYLESPLPCASGVTGSDLKKRIEAIMAHQSGDRLKLSKRLLLTVAAIGTAVGPVVLGVFDAPQGRAQVQSAAHPEFDVASVKAFKPGSAPENRTIIASHGSLLVRQETLRECIAWAYGLNNASEIDGPRWLDDEQYDISAKSVESTTQDQLRLMLQTLMAQRFKLRLHRKTEQRPVYLLVVGKGGSRLHELQTEPVKGAHFGSEEGFMTIQMVNRVPLLVEFLRIFLDHPVLDGTGLAGVYEINLRVELDGQQQLRQPGQAFMGFGMTPGVFPAVEQLGLKLVSQKGPVDILVVDHAERPSPN
jgi:bla regulator protein blaR1